MLLPQDYHYYPTNKYLILLVSISVPCVTNLAGDNRQLLLVRQNRFHKGVIICCNNLQKHKRSTAHRNMFKELYYDAQGNNEMLIYFDISNADTKLLHADKAFKPTTQAVNVFVLEARLVHGYKGSTRRSYPHILETTFF